MRDRSHHQSSEIALYLTPERQCAYLSDRLARTLFIDPGSEPSADTFRYLLNIGFRRSGDHVYRPHCDACRACVPVRVPVDAFVPRRSQRRCRRANIDRVQVRSMKPGLHPGQFELYLRYTGSRHIEGGMADADEARYMEFLTTRWCSSEFFEFRRDGRLMAVAVTDVLPDALSAVYTFFDPDLSAVSPGTFAILWQIEEARRRGHRHLYLGYWIGGCGKMSYKEGFRPLEAWDGRKWRRFEPGTTIDSGQDC